MVRIAKLPGNGIYGAWRGDSPEQRASPKRKGHRTMRLMKLRKNLGAAIYLTATATVAVFAVAAQGTAHAREGSEKYLFICAGD